MRDVWVSHLDKIARPVIKNLAEYCLREKMRVELGSRAFSQATYLEALGRTLCGIAPWLEAEPETREEGELQTLYRGWARKAIEAATDPDSPEYMRFDTRQNIVDTAFLSQGILRAPTELWEKLDTKVQGCVIAALKKTRRMLPPRNNWLLFSAMIEAALYKMGCEDYDPARIDYAFAKFSDWYVGDGMYSDGSRFHMDYYNSIVIHPMLTDLTVHVGELYEGWKSLRETVFRRLRRYSAIQERQIQPDGTFTVTGRSICYRSGCFHALAQAVLCDQLDPSLDAGAVRGAMTAMHRRLYDNPAQFDPDGWLYIGLSGHQPLLGEAYISTGSLYLCLSSFLPLGLPASHAFWTAPAANWTSVRLWSEDPQVAADHALSD